MWSLNTNPIFLISGVHLLNFLWWMRNTRVRHVEKDDKWFYWFPQTSTVRESLRATLCSEESHRLLWYTDEVSSSSLTESMNTKEEMWTKKFVKKLWKLKNIKKLRSYWLSLNLFRLNSKMCFSCKISSFDVSLKQSLQF